MKYFSLLVISILLISIARSQVNPPVIKIGNQIWMKKDLNVAKYRNGDPIPEVKDSATWSNLTTGAWCHYNNDPANDAIYGKEYNWYAVNDPRGMAPDGYHIPSDEEWTTLDSFLGSNDAVSTKMKSKTGWNGKGNGTNTSGFTALPNGGRINIVDYGFTGLGDSGDWWTSTESDTGDAWSRSLAIDDRGLIRTDPYKYCGFSVRCIKD